MGRIWMSGGGGGADLDVITAGAEDVAAPKVIVDRGGEPLVGTMSDHGAWVGSVGMNGSVVIPDGKHKNSKVSGPVITQRGAWTGRIGVNGKAVIPEGYHDGKGYVDQAINDRGSLAKTLTINETFLLPEGYYSGGHVNQSIPTRGGQSVTPTNGQQVVSCVSKYMTGDIVINPIPSGVNVNFGNAGGKNDHSTYSGKSKDMDVVYPNGAFGVRAGANILSIKNQGVEGLTINEESYCYDFYFESSTDYYSCNSFNIISQPIPCVNAKSITATIRSMGRREIYDSESPTRYSSYCHMRLSYFNDDGLKIEADERIYIWGYEGKGGVDSTLTKTVELNANYKAKYKWVCASVTYGFTAGTMHGQLVLYPGSGITDLYYTT